MSSSVSVISVEGRQESLAAMGLTQWYARKRLPGARPSPAFKSAKRPSSASSPESIQAKPAGLSEVKRLVTQAPPEGEKTVALKQAKNTIAINTPEKEVVAEVSMPSGIAASTPSLVEETFVLRLFRAGKFWVSSETSVSSSLSREQALLTNILSALGSNAPVEYVKALSWPVFDGRFMLQDQAGFTEEVITRWLHGLVSASASERYHFLHFGGARADLIDTVLKHSASESKFEPLIRLSCSLDEMLAMPTKKSLIWSELKQYRAVLGF